MEARRAQQIEAERLHRQSLESLGPRLVVPPTVVSSVELSPTVDTRASGLTASQEQESSRSTTTVVFIHPRHSLLRTLLVLTRKAMRKWMKRAHQPVYVLRLQLPH